MQQYPHEIPTHLNIEDKAFYGLSARQAMYLTIGCAGSYGLWNQWPQLPFILRLGLTAACLFVALLLALVRPYGRGLEEWAFVALHYAALPKAAVWRPREPSSSVWRSSSGAWADLAPRLAWRSAAGHGEDEVR
ncbi:MAG: PrgI family protein [Chloroflexi bacterium]|nr:PrgI family protein [Chloroflexota bacterium]